MKKTDEMDYETFLRAFGPPLPDDDFDEALWRFDLMVDDHAIEVHARHPDLHKHVFIWYPAERYWGYYVED